ACGRGRRVAGGLGRARRGRAEGWSGVMGGPVGAEPRRHRPWKRPTTAVGEPLSVTASTGEPLWPFTTAWLSRKISEEGADRSSCVVSSERIEPGERSSTGASNDRALCSLGGWSERARTGCPALAGSEARGKQETSKWLRKGLGAASRMAKSWARSEAVTLTLTRRGGLFSRLTRM